MDWCGRVKSARSAVRTLRAINCARLGRPCLPAARDFVSVQNQYSLVHREPEADVLPECVRTGIAFIPYFPLANGLLTGKYRRGQPLPEGSRAQAGFGPKVFTDANLELVESLSEFAAARGHTMLELAVSWLAAQPAVASVIAGAKSPEQVKANASAGAWRLTAEDLAAIEGGTRGRRNRISVWQHENCASCWPIIRPTIRRTEAATNPTAC